MLRKEIIDCKNIKIKPMSLDKILICIDRLTRFKNPEDKYLRVYKDVILSNLIFPQINKHELDLMEYKNLTQLAQNIINFSLLNIDNTVNDDYKINEKLSEYENRIFKIEDNVQQLLDNRIDYKKCFPFITENSPENLRWLKVLGDENTDDKAYRKENNLRFPIEKIVIVEGATEEILLPKFADILGYNVKKEGVFIISAGGKNQVVKLYYKMVEQLKIPMFILLDKDAVENSKEINARIRSADKIHLLNCGEFEDLLPKTLIKKSLEYDLNNISLFELEKFNEETPTVKLLEEVYRTRGYHEFKKVDFANIVYKNVENKNDISKEIEEIIKEIKILC